MAPPPTAMLAQPALPTQATGAMVRSNACRPVWPASAARPSAPGATDSAAHSSASGVTMNVTAGIATALASGRQRHLVDRK